MPLPSLFSPHISRDFPSAIADACANHFFTPSYPLFREQHLQRGVREMKRLVEGERVNNKEYPALQNEGNFLQDEK